MTFASSAFANEASADVAMPFITMSSIAVQAAM
jgi:hypothetical protein